MLANGAVAWQSKIQSRVATSSTKAEYLGLNVASSEVIFLRNLLTELGFPPTGPIQLWGDNQGANAAAAKPVFGRRMHHLRLSEHAIRERIAERLVKVNYISTKDMVADTLTKPLGRPKFDAHCKGLGVVPLSSA